MALPGTTHLSTTKFTLHVTSFCLNRLTPGPRGWNAGVQGCWIVHLYRDIDTEICTLTQILQNTEYHCADSRTAPVLTPQSFLLPKAATSLGREQGQSCVQRSSPELLKHLPLAGRAGLKANSSDPSFLCSASFLFTYPYSCSSLYEVCRTTKKLSSACMTRISPGSQGADPHPGERGALGPDPCGSTASPSWHWALPFL